jgi:hypothetical protein
MLAVFLMSPWFSEVHLMLIIFTVAFKNAKNNICMTPHPQHPIGLWYVPYKI